jgi:hypothetical protein
MVGPNDAGSSVAEQLKNKKPVEQQPKVAETKPQGNAELEAMKQNIAAITQVVNAVSTSVAEALAELKAVEATKAAEPLLAPTYDLAVPEKAPVIVLHRLTAEDEKKIQEQREAFAKDMGAKSFHGGFWGGVLGGTVGAAAALGTVAVVSAFRGSK